MVKAPGGYFSNKEIEQVGTMCLTFKAQPIILFKKVLCVSSFAITIVINRHI